VIPLAASLIATYNQRTAARIYLWIGSRVRRHSGRNLLGSYCYSIVLLALGGAAKLAFVARRVISVLPSPSCG